MSVSLSPERILHIINGEHYSGAERVQDLLALRLPSQGIEVGFVCIKPVHFAARRSSKAPLFEVPMRSKLDLRVGRRIAAIAREGNYRLIHTHTPRAALIGRIASHFACVPMIHHVHSPTRFDTEKSWRNWLNAGSERVSAKGALALIAVSDKVKDYLERESFPPDRIHVVANGVPIQKGLAPWQPPQDRPWEIGMIALFRPRKGLEVLLDAMVQLRGRGLAIRLRAIGPFESSAYEAEIRRQVKAKKLEDAIHWVGYTQHVNEELARMDIFVLPSLYGEGLPMVLLEAMAAGVPIIASNVDGVSQAIRHGIDGLLVEPGDPESLGLALQAIMKGQYSPQALRQSAHARQSSEFSDERMARDVAGIYRKVLG